MKHVATKMVITPIPNKCCSFELRFSSRVEWAQQQYVLPSTYKGGDAEFVVTKQQASCLGWSLLNGKIQHTIASIQHLLKTIPIQVAQHLKAHCTIMWMKACTDLS